MYDPRRSSPGSYEGMIFCYNIERAGKQEKYSKGCILLGVWEKSPQTRNLKDGYARNKLPTGTSRHNTTQYLLPSSPHQKGTLFARGKK
ncbi:hypothetical protein EYC84_000417 [Monilinia fructicola]|uniref:Uncharacterized protein n=1 Tax=Monilinia fructicola TaxID=38448 RepID=A0A5M9JT77_MONFR|nr:hypothetical protein EYC84_000417 [Monilinia fructicola]